MKLTARFAGAWARVVSLACAVLIGAATVSAVRAQDFPSAPPPPTGVRIDANGIDLISGALNLSAGTLSIGGPGSGLSYGYLNTAASATGGLIGTINADSATGVVFASLGDSTEKFQGGTTVNSITTYVNAQGGPSKLTRDYSNQTFVYTRGDGSVAVYSSNLVSTHPRQANAGYLTSLTLSTGEQLTYTYKGWSFCGGYNFGTCMRTLQVQRVKAISSNLGYQLHFSYQSDGVALGDAPKSWTYSKIVAINTAVEYCDPNADACTGLTQIWPTVTFVAGAISNNSMTMVATDAAGQTTTTNSTYLQRPSGAAVSKASVSSNSFTLTNGVGTWAYAWSDNGDVRTLVVTDPQQHTRTVVSNVTKALVLSDTNGESKTTTYQYDSYDRLVRITQPEGNYVHYTYDARGNVTEKREVSKTPGTPADIVTSAGYDTACANPKICNKPVWTRDPLNNQTDYVYTTTSNGDVQAVSVTSPAPAANGVRPQTRYTYVQLPSYSKNATGALIQTGSIWKLTSTSACASLATCTGGADEVKTVTTFSGPNLLPTSTTTGSGDGALSATTTTTYDDWGNVVTVDGPLAGSGDTTRFRYDAVRRLVGTIEPATTNYLGQTKHAATRTTYVAGRVTQVEQGTVASQADGDWAQFASLQQQSTTYDAIDRVVRSTLTAGGVIFGVTQYSYDTANRAECTALRVNPANSSLPGACAIDVANDQIAKSSYDRADRVTIVTKAFGSAVPINEVTAYTSNGRVASVTDGGGNLTTYEYDGVDRLARTRYPNASGGGSSTSDFSQTAYDAASNVTQEIRRGQVTNYSYDALNRITYRDDPKGWYHYDNLGRPTFTYSGASAEKSVANYYDALGRPSFTYDSRNGVAAPTRTTYDVAGRRTGLQWSDGFGVSYDYDVAGRLTAIRESTGAGLVSFDYDDLGQRHALTRANGVVTTALYDAASRLTSLSHTFPGGSGAQTRTFDRDGMGRIVSNTATNAPSSAWSSGIGNRGYALNGLNQVTESGQLILTYDKGNLATDGAGASYGYDADNRLTTATGGGVNGALTYDALGRLEKVVDATTTTRFGYDGEDLIAEYDADGVLLRRYVHGPGDDEPLIWYESGSATPAAATRRWFLADERGSIVTTTDNSGVILSTNSYDEFGIGPSNSGRFQFTGQVWLPEIGLYHFKARAYSPNLGRFLQTDPIGYDDGLNWYAYVGNDPINMTDPSGLDGRPGSSCFVGSPGCDGNATSDDITVTASGCAINAFCLSATDVAHLVLGAGSFCPGICGSGFALVDAGVYAWNGDKAGALISVGAAAAGVFSDAGAAKALALGAKEAAVLGREAALAKGACNCFEAGTPVATADGPRAIETIKVGDLVLSRNELTGETAFKPVKALIPGKEREIWDVTVELRGKGGVRRDVIHTTEEHPFRTTDGAWTPAAKLKSSMTVSTAAGVAKVLSVAQAGRVVRTYNLEITDFHTYFVGEGQAWVHNSCVLSAQRLAHVFVPKHNLGRLVTKFGSQEAAANAIHAATEAAVQRAGTSGVFQMGVQVGGQTVTVTGNVVNGVLKFGNAWIP